VSSHAKPLRSIGVVHPESSEYVLSVQLTQAEPYWLSVGRFEEGRSIILIQADPHVSSEIAYRIPVNVDVNDLFATCPGVPF
jgi:hypothetical protein